MDCRKLKKKQEDAKAKANPNATATGTLKSFTFNSSSSTTAKVAVASSPLSENVMHLFCILAVSCPHTAKHVLQAQTEPSNASDLMDGWIINSEASHNMSSHRNWFHHYAPLHGKTYSPSYSSLVVVQKCTSLLSNVTSLTSVSSSYAQADYMATSTQWIWLLPQWTWLAS